MNESSLKNRSFVSGALFFFGFMAWQFVSHGKAETIDFVAAMVLAVAVGLGSFYVAKSKSKQK